MMIHHMTDKTCKRLLNYESLDLVKQPNYELSYLEVTTYIVESTAEFKIV